MKKEFTKSFKEEFKEQEKEELLNKKAEAFLERFKQMSPAEQKRCIKKLNYEIGLIDAEIKDAQDNMPSYHTIKLTKRQKIIISIASALVFGSSIGGAIGTITKSLILGMFFGSMGAFAGYHFGELPSLLAEAGFLDNFIDFFRDLKTKRLNKKIIKHEAKQLKLAKRLELIKSAQPQENEFMLN